MRWALLRLAGSSRAKSLYRFYNGEFIIQIAVDVSYINEVIASKGIRVKVEQDFWSLDPLLPDDKWGERGVSPRAIGLFGAEFISLGWFIDNMITGTISVEMDRWNTEFLSTKDQANHPNLP